MKQIRISARDTRARDLRHCVSGETATFCCCRNPGSVRKKDGRKNLGSNIMIHGKNCSVGCLAMGDEAAEELFVLAA
jgi:hypothetical protein